MFISECKTNETVTLRCEKGDRVGNFDLKVRAVSGMDEQVLRRKYPDRKFCMVLEPLRMKGKLVNLEVPGMRYDVIDVINKEAMCWRGVKLNTTTLSGTDKVIVIYCAAQGIHVERRRSERLPVGVEGDIIALGKTLRRVFVRDISIGGVGITMPKGSTLQKGSEFQLEWEEKFRVKGVEKKHYMSFPVKVARVTSLDASRNVVGCRIMQYNQKDMGIYMQEKTAALTGNRSRR